MAIKTIIQAFRDVQAASSEVNSFIYGKAWDLNGIPNVEFPNVLVDNQPDFSNVRQRSSGLASMKEYNLKVFIYGEYWNDEQATNNDQLETKQDELEIIFDTFLSEVYVELSKKGVHVQIEGSNGFHAWWKSHNSSLVPISVKVKLLAPANCP